MSTETRRSEMAHLIRWDPLGDMDRNFNRMLRRAFAAWPRMSSGEEGATRSEWAPSVDISETDKEYTLRAELPAIRKEDVRVTVDGGLITIEGERKQQKEEKNERYHQVESFYGTFTRSFSLPDDVNVDAIRCEDKDGILTVHLPKTEAHKSKPRQIAVQ